MTSRMPHETGVRDNDQGIVPGTPNLGEHFRARGYRAVYSTISSGGITWAP